MGDPTPELEELEADRETETVWIVDIYEDAPQVDIAPWQNAVIEGVQDDEAEEF